MSADDIFYTLSEPSEGSYREKGSRFLAFAFPVETEDLIKKHLADLKNTYHNARHVCFAWQLGFDGMNYRVNDDGEPSGTAGKPIFGQIRSHNLSNVLIIVVRYFGGTKLGTSGLINAYKEAAADAIKNGNIIKKTINSFFSLNFSYDQLNNVMRIIKEMDLQIIHQDFGLNCKISLSVRESLFASVKSRFEAINGVKLIDDIP